MAYDDEAPTETSGTLSAVRGAPDRSTMDRPPNNRSAAGSLARAPGARGPQPKAAEDAPTIADAALRGLLGTPKTLPPSLFYDEEGCRLFYEITKLPEYYLTRTEFRLLQTKGPELVATLPAGTTLVEYGASDETKAEMLLRQAVRTDADGPGVFATYIPIDVAAPELQAMHDRLAVRRPDLTVRPVAADFLRPIQLPEREAETAILGFFPGSTIGNLEPAAAVAFLRRARTTLGLGARMLLGFDTCRDPARLVPAYDDAQGVTARFNRNLLVRLNREAAATFDPNDFAHRAIWNPAESRIEMHLVSNADQTVMLAGQPIRFARGESIHTENSYKYATARMHAMVETAGWMQVKTWSDPEQLFALWLLSS